MGTVEGGDRGSLPFAHCVIILDQDFIVVLFTRGGHCSIGGTNVLGHCYVRASVYIVWERVIESEMGDLH